MAYYDHIHMIILKLGRWSDPATGRRCERWPSWNWPF